MQYWVHEIICWCFVVKNLSNEPLCFSSSAEGVLSNTGLYNLLNFPAGAVTVSTVTEEDEAQLKQYKGCFGDMWDKLFVKARQRLVYRWCCIKSMYFNDVHCAVIIQHAERNITLIVVSGGVHQEAAYS